MKENRIPTISESVKSPEFTRFKDLIAKNDKTVTTRAIVKNGLISLEETAELLVKLSERNEEALAEALGMLKRHGIVDQRAKPRAFGEKGHIEVSKDGKQRTI